MSTTLDLDAYFDRIGWGGPTRPDYDTLSGLLAAHMRRIPFENLDVLLGRPVRLDLDGLQAKLVRSRRGGYCFEHATLFAAVLEALGFRPVRHTARVVVIVPRAASPRTHMFLTVPVTGRTYVVDPGFGALAPRVPVPLVENAAVSMGAERHWMARDGVQWILRTQAGEQAVDGWVSPLDADNPVDFEVGNHYTSTFSGSPFVNRLMMRALIDGGRVTVMNRDVTITRNGQAQVAQLADRGALRALLLEHFGIDFPEADRLRVPSIPEWA